ncbi:8-oxo-dGTP pyrophosphatase MutT (NUDIX family) [Brevibacterium sanguinis]|uniref:8-oxo-dGTP pyrophosphatase MutT (NUDIX family) n=2 Tax=Brevibacterium TaxID=1696 RepID=A0A366INA7_9MICO|nr:MULTISPECIES: NUDIX domain-containing protein [Brevibacterium]RBP66315.1 8-oxo-dGTP pyrophosphatase MutT (NUDIX family) [Brevibacterium sanguinis]RBP72966.1 8-oxo-dGTP pyrophosphatase MutT (NUDIX family) [Brevibacterium celere]
MPSPVLDLDAARAEVAAVSAQGSGDVGSDFEELFATFGAAALLREGGPEHLTASCLVVDLESRAVLLNHHRKAGLWGQFGGHLEPADPSLRAAAHREALEESGLAGFDWFSPAPVDLHVHDLSQAFGACTRHFDVVFAAAARAGTAPIVSEESLDVRWFPLTDPPRDLMPDLVVRLPVLWRAAAAAAGH